MRWLEGSRDRFDLIFCDPPTFSNSKRMQDVLDINRDYLAAYYAVLVALSYQAMTIWLAVRHRDQFPVPGLALSIILLEIGYVLALLLPGVRELMVPNWFTLVAVAIIGCGLHRMSVPSPVLSVPAAQTDDG